MVFRKPYAFLIKNFRKIHILLLILWGYIFFKISNLKGFIGEFITYGTYNKNVEGISTKINFLLYLSIIAIIVISIILLWLLKYKKKPWKLYLVLILEYGIIFYNCVAISSFFNNYKVTDTVSSVFMYRDMLNIASWIQYAVLVILILRITGLDLKKFEFGNDKEFLELTSKDREEVEISFEIDKHSFKRKFNQLKRNLGYFYKEHKKIVHIALIAVILVFVGSVYKYFMVTNKSYKQGDTYYFWYYGITVNKAYVTDKNAAGKVIEEGNKFVVINVTIENTSDGSKNADLSKFYLMNKSINRSNTTYYDNDFKDIGKGASRGTKIGAHEKKNFILVYKMPKDLDNKNFVLYFQEYNGYNNTYLRKIKLNIEDVSSVKESKSYKVGEEIVFDLLDDSTSSVTLQNYTIADRISFNKYSCDDRGCGIKTKEVGTKKGKKILKVEFSSSDYEGEEFVDFTTMYGIIKYVDNNGNAKIYELENVVDEEYVGKEMYLYVNNTFDSAKEVYLNYTIRKKEYNVRLK